MPSFVFKARDRGGRTQQGASAADSAGTVVNRLRERGWLVLDVRAAAAARSGVISLRGLAPHNWLPPRSVDVEFSLRQEAVMLRSGITLLGALNMVAEQSSRTQDGPDLVGRRRPHPRGSQPGRRHEPSFAVLARWWCNWCASASKPGTSSRC